MSHFFDLLLDFVEDDFVLLIEVAGFLAGVEDSSEEPASVRDFLLAARSPRVAFDVDGDGVGVGDVVYKQIYS